MLPVPSPTGTGFFYGGIPGSSKPGNQPASPLSMCIITFFAKKKMCDIYHLIPSMPL
jgi:hypothetical protein